MSKFAAKGAALSSMGGALAWSPLFLHCCLKLHLRLTAKPRWYIDAPNLIIALVGATVFVRPVLLTRSYPPTLIQLRRSFQHQQCHLSCWQEGLHAPGCHELSLLRQHPLLPPSYPLPLVVRYVYLWGEGLPIYSVFVARLYHHRSAQNASPILVVLTNVIAAGLPIHRCTFFMGGIIGPMLPTNNQSTLNGWAYVGYRTKNFPLLVTPLAVPVTETVLVM